MLRHLTRVQAVVALAARVGIGVIFIAHGYQKLFDLGIPAVTQGFGKMGVPVPAVSAWYAGLVEFLGGIALIAGLALPVVGILLFLDMAGAYVFVDSAAPLIGGAGQPGFELVLALGVASLLIGFAGGPIALDRLLLRRFQPALSGGHLAAGGTR